MVVPVFIINCHCSEKLAAGPVINQAKTIKNAIIIAELLPENFVIVLANFSKKSGFDF